MPLNIQKKEGRNAEGTIILLRDKNELEHPSLKPFSSVLEKKFSDTDNGIVLFYTPDGPVLVVLLKPATQTDKPEESLEIMRLKGGHIVKRINHEKCKSVSIARVSASILRDELLAFTEGMALGNYQFLKYKSEKKENTLQEILVDDIAVDAIELEGLLNIVDAACIARDLANEPVNALNAIQLSERIIHFGKSAGFKTEILHKAQIEALRMGGLLGVNAGSSVPPTFNILSHQPANAVNSRPLIFIGKGVTYDTGGYSIKTGTGMAGMKMDMSGAAAVIGAMVAIAKENLPVYCIGIIPATDNRINSDALVPDDVITMHNGTTVEVLNTDAEGRLILADALSYAKKYQPELVIDLATLTGAAAVITGTLGAACMGTDTTYKSMLMAAGADTYERIWDIPYWKEYGDLLKSDVADLKNIGGSVGGSATAGKFLEHFTDYPWLHLDIAGPAILKDEEPYKPKGGSGFGVRLLVAFVKRFVKDQVHSSSSSRNS